jgi:hypothetical protein
MGWIAVVAGCGSIGAGIIQGATGTPTTASRILTIVGPTVITLWTATIGVPLIRKSRSQQVTGHPAQPQTHPTIGPRQGRRAGDLGGGVARQEIRHRRRLIMVYTGTGKDGGANGHVMQVAGSVNLR